MATNCWCYVKTQMCSPCLKKKKHTSIDFSDWPLHTYRSRPFEPVQSVLVTDVFFIPELLLFYIDWTCLTMRKIAFTAQSKAVLFILISMSWSEQPYSGFDICGSTRCCCPLSVFLTAECCRKVVTEIELNILNIRTINSFSSVWDVIWMCISQLSVYLLSLGEMQHSTATQTCIHQTGVAASMRHWYEVERLLWPGTWICELWTALCGSASVLLDYPWLSLFNK